MPSADPQKLTNELSQFTGSEHWYKHSLGILYTDGVQYLAKHGQAYWLLDAIASYQPMCRLDPVLGEIQFWTLTVKPDNSATLLCEYDAGEPAFSQSIPFTDFPLPEIKLYVCNCDTICLPSEY